LKLGITMLIHNKDDIEFVTEFPCFLGHPVWTIKQICNHDLKFKVSVQTNSVNFSLMYWINNFKCKISSGWNF